MRGFFHISIIPFPLLYAITLTVLTTTPYTFMECQTMAFKARERGWSMNMETRTDQGGTTLILYFQKALLYAA